MTINVTFESFEEMEQFCRDVVQKQPAKKSKAEEKKPAEQSKQVKTEEPAPVEEEEAAPAEEITVEQVRKAAGAYMKKNGKDAFTAVLAEFGAKNVTSLAESDYAAFMQKVGE